MRHLSRPLLCALATLAVTAAAEAGVDRWTPIGLGSGAVEALAVDPTAPGVVYAAAGEAGIYRSTDGARSWVWRGLATAFREEWTAVAVSPADPQRLYATTRPPVPGEGAVYTSGDAGATWTQLFRHDTGFNSIAVSRDGTLLASGERFEVFRSADGGATWSFVLKPGFGGGGMKIALAFDPLAPQTAYAGVDAADAGLWRSTDGGATWQQVGTLPDGQPVAGVTALALPGTRPGFLYGLMRSALYRSQDGGLTWAGGAQLSGGSDVLAVDPRDAATVYAGGLKEYVSHDGGDSATAVSSTFPHTTLPEVAALAVSPAAPTALYAAANEVGVAVSHDGGQHWSLAEQRGLSADRFVGFQVGASGRLYEAPYADGSVFRSADHGASWSPLAPPAPGGFSSPPVEDAGSPASLWAVTLTPALFHSTDGGATWRPTTPGLAASAVASPSPGVVLAGGCGVARSADNGRSWALVVPCVVGEAGGLARRLVHRLGVVPGWPGRAWAEIEVQGPAGETTLVLFSQDSGRTWRVLTQRTGFDPAVRLVAAARGVLYLNSLGGGTTLLRTLDAGRHWAVRGAVGDQAVTLAVDPADPDLVLVATAQHGVLRSRDGALTWADANAGLARMGRRTMRELFADPSLPAVFYALPAAGGVFEIQLAAP